MTDRKIIQIASCSAVGEEMSAHVTVHALTDTGEVWCLHNIEEGWYLYPKLPPFDESDMKF